MEVEGWKMGLDSGAGKRAGQRGRMMGWTVGSGDGLDGRLAWVPRPHVAQERPLPTVGPGRRLVRDQ